MIKKCYSCGGYIQGVAYVIAKASGLDPELTYTVTLYDSEVKVFHPGCFGEVAGIEFLTSKDRRDIGR